jgi:hypothetical protein
MKGDVSEENTPVAAQMVEPTSDIFSLVPCCETEFSALSRIQSPREGFAARLSAGGGPETTHADL